MGVRGTAASSRHQSSGNRPTGKLPQRELSNEVKSQEAGGLMEEAGEAVQNG